MSEPNESSEPKVVRAQAEIEFERWAKAMRLQRKIDPSTLNDEDKRGFALTKGAIIGAIEDGYLTCNDQGLFELQAGDKRLVFKKPKGSALMAMDQAKSDAGVHKTMKFLAEMCGVPTSTFANMDVADYQVCDAIALLFLAK